MLETKSRIDMKLQTLVAIAIFAGCVAALQPGSSAVEPAVAQVADPDATQVEGTIAAYVAASQTLFVKTETGRTLRCQITQRTAIVDEKGEPLLVATLGPGKPVVVHYSYEAGRLVATKIVMRQLPTAETRKAS